MLTAAALAALAAWLVVPGPPASRFRRLEAARARPRSIAWKVAPPVTAGVVAAGLVVVVMGPGALGWAVAVGVSGGTVCWMVLARISARRARRRADEVARAARLLSSLLNAGQIPTVALGEAAADFPVLAPAASSAQVGGDIAAALRQGASAPGGDGLRTIAAAWQVSSRSGAPVAGVLRRVADSLRLERQVAEIVETELAAARTSGQIMAALPFAAVALGFFAGVNSLEFIFGAGLGQWLCAAAVVLTAAGLMWIERLAKR